MGDIIFVTGGARSGKSRFAEGLTVGAGAAVVYLAMMQPGDDELRARIERHRARRPVGWETIEEPLRVAEALAGCDLGTTVLLDCVSLWVSNLLFEDGSAPNKWEPPRWERFVDGCLQVARGAVDAQLGRTGRLIVVSNETGMGIVPADRLTRYYRDALGLVNQEFARAATEAYLLVSGLPVRLK
jgi:adenosylcobinamide kinase/adenosylcobinamide-phosphate guanylyltransferase